MRKIFLNSLWCYTDICLFEDGYSSGIVNLLSIYGAPQQVKAVGAGLLNYKDLATENKMRIMRSYSGHYRFRIFSMGKGKCHGVLWRDDINKNWFFWLNPEEQNKIIKWFLLRRKIPIEQWWIPNLYNLLIKKEMITPLKGWGADGFFVNSLNDDEVCDLIIKNEKTFLT